MILAQKSKNNKNFEIKNWISALIIVILQTKAT